MPNMESEKLDAVLGDGGSANHLGLSPALAQTGDLGLQVPGGPAAWNFLASVSSVVKVLQ